MARMSDDKMGENEYLAAVRKDREESVRFFSSGNRPERELWVANEFLANLGLEFLESELESVTRDPPDVRFRDAAFEIKEILEIGRRRHAEYKALLRKALKATKPSDLIEPVKARDITYKEVYELVETRVLELVEKYDASTRSELDLLFYVNFDDIYGYIKTPLPDPTQLQGSGFRSVSIVMGRLSGVLMTTAVAPIFLCAGGPRMVARP